MVNDITGQYHKQGDFSKREQEVLVEVKKLTGFKVDQLIFKGIIYKSDKIGSLIYRGQYKGKTAVLKLQGVPVQVDEYEITKAFNLYNQSKIIRLPEIYLFQPWLEDKGYSFFISEWVDAPRIFTMPWATTEQMQEYAAFFQEYKTNCLANPWLSFPSINITVKDYLLAQASKRKIICQKVGRIPEKLADYIYHTYLEYVNNYLPTDLKMTFCHAHLSANDIYKISDKEYVLMSNLFWGYRPEWYELAINLWACLISIREHNLQPKQSFDCVQDWLKVYKEIPVVQQDSNFERKFWFLMAERAVGAILADLGVNDEFAKPEMKDITPQLLKMFENLFYMAGFEILRNSLKDDIFG